MNEQRSPEWFKERLGCVTGSVVAEVMAKATGKKSEASSRKNLRAKLALELMTGQSRESYSSWDMQRGEQLEPEARMAYELKTGFLVETTGFLKHKMIERFGASPDGLIGADGILEIKCPNAATHMEYCLSGVLPNEYRRQVQAELACSGRQWADFVSYHPDMPDNLKLFQVRVKRDEVAIAEIEAEVIKFNSEVDDMIERLTNENYLADKLKESIAAVR